MAEALARLTLNGPNGCLERRINWDLIEATGVDHVAAICGTLEEAEPPSYQAPDPDDIDITEDALIEMPIVEGDTERNLKLSTALHGAQVGDLLTILRDNAKVFAWSYHDMPGLDPRLVQHNIILDPKIKPVKQRSRRLKPELALAVREEITKLYQVGFIRAVDYADWVSNIVVVSKKTGGIRICIDFRDLNKATIKDDFPLPNIDQLVDATACHALLSFMDGFSGYNQIRINPEHQLSTTFMTPWGTFCYTMMPFGLKNAGATYQRAMTYIFSDYLMDFVTDYVDDIAVKSKDAKNHPHDLDAVLKRCDQHNLRLNPKKCVFGVKTGKLLGFIVSEAGIRVDPSKVEAIRNLAPPRDLTELRGLQGRIQFIRRFIARLSDKLQPMNHLLKKGIVYEWTPACQAALDNLKQELASLPVMFPPQLNQPFYIYLATSPTAFASLLCQRRADGAEIPIYYLSHALVSYELRYNDVERCCLALVFSLKKWRHYLFRAEVNVICRDNILRTITTNLYESRRIARWKAIIAEYDLNYLPQTSVKGQAIASQLMDSPLPGNAIAEPTFPDEHISSVDSIPEGHDIVMHFDGAATNQGASAAVIFTFASGEMQPYAFQLQFPCTNNVAEYEGLIRGLLVARKKGITKLCVRGDSQLIINQVTNVFACKAPHLVPYCTLAKNTVKQFSDVQIEYIPRASNTIADAMATLALKISPSLTLRLTAAVQACKDPITQNIEQEQINIVDAGEWYDNLKSYLLQGHTPQHLTSTQKDALRKRAKQYAIVNDVLCRRSYDGVLLVCVGKTDAHVILEQVHDGVCGGHIGPRAMAAKIRRLGYYWPYMEQDCHQKTKTCDACQRHGNVMHVAPNELHTTQIAWPFQRWGLDIIGPITPASTARHTFIITATEYFTKWIEAIPLRKTTAQQVCRFILDNIISRFGLPMVIVTDNGPQFSSGETAKFCRDFGIKHAFSSPYYPQANGQAEAGNKIIINLLKKMIGSSKRWWHEQMLHALWAYRTTFRTATGATPYSLVYGSEAVLPLELQVPSLRVTLANFLSEEQQQHLRGTDLDAAEEQRLNALRHIEHYQEQQRQHHRHNLTQRPVQKGDLVLKAVRNPADKFAPNWEGPFVVMHAFGNGAFTLADAEGRELANPVNHTYLKPYYT